MKLAAPYAENADALKAALNGGTLVLYSVARPASPDVPVERSGKLASFTFASPAFEVAGEPRWESNPVVAMGTGTPGFGRAFQADGTAIADFSVGPGSAEITLSEVSTSSGFPVTITQIRL
jgi:hypothetical protein